MRTVIYTRSLHDALPILAPAVDPPADATVDAVSDFRNRAGALFGRAPVAPGEERAPRVEAAGPARVTATGRSEEHTSELQSQFHLVCRLLLGKKKDSAEV